MKRIVISLVFASFFMFGFSQKKELRSISKMVSENAFSEAKSSLESIEGLVANSEVKYQTQYQFLLGNTLSGLKDYQGALAAYKALESLESSSGLSKYAKELPAIYEQLTADLVNSAIEDNKTKNYESSFKKLFLSYEINKENNQDYLYYAASSAINGEFYQEALGFYLTLKEQNYTGITKEYYVTDKESGEESLVSKQEFDLYKKSKSYTNFREADTESRLPEIVKNIALIYVQQGKVEEAIEAISDARAANPKDLGLILTEADLYIKLDDKEKFAELMVEAIDQDPTNPVLYFNLGVINSGQGNAQAAREYYEKSIELDPSYRASYLNLVTLILDGEKELVDEMNSLGNSRADNLKYDQLLLKREGLYREVVPYLEKSLGIDGDDVEVLNTLKNIYGTLGETERFREIKAKIEALEQ